jgi:hypothetical protein
MICLLFSFPDTLFTSHVSGVFRNQVLCAIPTSPDTWHQTMSSPLCGYVRAFVWEWSPPLLPVPSCFPALSSPPFPERPSYWQYPLQGQRPGVRQAFFLFEHIDRLPQPSIAHSRIEPGEVCLYQLCIGIYQQPDIFTGLKSCNTDKPELALVAYLYYRSSHGLETRGHKL